ncbi:MAG: MCE family protein [Acidimicrobiales bacterium]|nr:MCE family protein [Actinomycetota bacterium]
MVLTRRLIANLVVFALASVALVGYGLVDLLGNPFTSPMQISTVMPTAAGLHPGFSVALNGVDVGSVSAVDLVRGGARVVMTIDKGVSIPSSVEARVNLANALGEQQVDLVPRATLHDPPLRNGATVPLAPDGAPTEVSQVVSTATKLLQAIPPHALNSLLSELSTALAGQAGNLQTITDSSKVFAQELLAYQSQFKALLANAPPVLDTVAADGPALQQALANTAVIAHVFAQHRNDIVNLFNSGSNAFGDLGSIVAAERPNLACLFHDLAGLNSNLSQPANLVNLSSGLQDNSYFWNLIPTVVKDGSAASLFPGEPSRSNQPWLRTQLQIPPVQPTPLSYATPHTLPPTKPGAGCVTSLGNGVGPATQTGYHSSLPESRLSPAPSSESYVPGVPGAGQALSAYRRAVPGRGRVGYPGLPALFAFVLALAALATVRLETVSRAIVGVAMRMVRLGSSAREVAGRARVVLPGRSTRGSGR